MAYFDEADESVEYASLRIASRKQMSKCKVQESIGLFELWEAERALSGKQELRRRCAAGEAEGMSPTLLLKSRGEFFKESELSCLTTVQKKMNVGEGYKVSVMLREDEKERERREGAVKMRETRRGLNRKLGEKNAKRRAMEMSETMLASQLMEERKWKREKE
ncbi:uncharacterized protein MONOS_13150 [Monocercomonoides exilis]|uniref:uncharacterized protein n=1 Tax=Monocercomonoides exilis TaxID=2049356 RepID=UPI003559F067|nr:hypothetical protein MONOS_13150 [Monocercomonoides exilis]|eukprot:MONOS_13150.1-p1 / transcript=MONOS_13150.1 / gene=MONOS_13150 / organism=Monocercomonoides_exilis_PA203 / gene_product=unspecified product / transcript_product=unspecified product / location=Mono_scaffold00783:19138-19693(+) / protein_length=163 / sequence_SO=supercontig / SO=protein_coding / is_pseudo=false